MDIQRQFAGVHWVWGGGISFVYEVQPLIVVKVPKPGGEEREKFRRELEIYEILSQHPRCPSLVECFLYAADGIFLEYMRDISLAYGKQFNMTRDNNTRVVTKVKYLEPLPLQKLWMNDLAQGVAFLGSLNLAHGDLRPENILLDRNQLKISDFDCTAENCWFPKHLINYGFEVYDNQCLADDPYEHGPKVVDLLMDMKFPKLEADPLIDDIIDKCWHNRYRTLADLAIHTEALLKGPISDAQNHAAPSTLGAQQRSNTQVASNDSYNMDQYHSAETLSKKRELCQDLEKRGLLRLLTSGKPMELAFTMEHRHVLPTAPAN